MITFFALISWQFIALIIGVFFIIGILLGIKLKIILKEEHDNLKKAKASIPHLTISEDKLAPESEETAEFYDVSKLLSEKVEMTVGPRMRPARSVVWERIKNLERVQKNAGRFDRNSLSEIARSRLRSQTASIRYIAGILILLGLFGTLCGLTRSVQGLANAVERTQNTELTNTSEVDSFINELKTQLAATLQGMRIAFITTLLGVLATIILTGFLSWLNRQLQGFLAELESFTTTDLLPIYLPRSESSNLEKITGDIRSSSISLAAISEKHQLARQQEISLNTNLNSISLLLQELITKSRDETIFQTLNRTISELTNQVSQNSNFFQSFGNVLDELKRSISDIIGGELSARTQFLENFQKSITDQSNQLGNNLTQIVSTIRGEYSKQLELNKGIETASKNTLQMLKSMNEIQQNNNNILLNLKQGLVDSNRLEQVNELIAQQTVTLTQTLQSGLGADSLFARLEAGMQQLNTVIKAIQETISQDSEFAGLETRLDDSKNLLSEIAESVKSGAVLSALQKIEDEMKKNDPQNTVSVLERIEAELGNGRQKEVVTVLQNIETALKTDNQNDVLAALNNIQVELEKNRHSQAELLPKILQGLERQTNTEFEKEPLRKQKGRVRSNEHFEELLYRIDDYFQYQAQRRLSSRIRSIWRKIVKMIRRLFRF